MRRQSLGWQNIPVTKCREFLSIEAALLNHMKRQVRAVTSGTKFNKTLIVRGIDTTNWLHKFKIQRKYKGASQLINFNLPPLPHLH